MNQAKSINDMSVDELLRYKSRLMSRLGSCLSPALGHNTVKQIAEVNRRLVEIKSEVPK